MNENKPFVAGVLLIALSLFATDGFAQNSSPDLWYFQQAYPESPTDVTNIAAQIDQAFSYGYTGVVFWSTTFNFMGSTVFPANNVPYMQQLISYAQSKGMKTTALVSPYGYSDDALINNPNWAEGQHVTGSQFTVNATKTALVPVNSFPGLVNPGFESNTGWFDFGDSDIGIDPTVSHSGSASGLLRNATGFARFHQYLNVIPWRQYHCRIWIKTQNFSGSPVIEVYDSNSGTNLFYTPIFAQATQDWTLLEFTFNSRTATQPGLYFGVWGGSSGSMWFDDALVEETSLVYLLRRSGTPLTVYDPANPTHMFWEGTDFNPILDPQLSSGAYYPFTNLYHDPGVVTLLPTTTLQAGQTVAMDYYAVEPIFSGGDVGICLTEAGAQKWLQQNAQAVTGNLPGAMNYMLSYDEMRHMNSCASCRAKNLTAGQLLASHVSSTAALYQSLAPSASLFVWSDMFDPFHNAVNHYYYVEGDIAGSWMGVPENVTIMNWNLGNLPNSLTWFSGRNSQQPTAYRQVIAGYYDSGDGASAAAQELQQSSGIPGVMGLMYTSWNIDYSQLQQFATAAKQNWPAYLASLVTNVTSQVSVGASVITYNRGTRLYSQTVKLTNNGRAMAAVAYVADSLPAGVSMYQPSGTTSATVPAGSPYMEAGPIGAGASVTITVQFTRTGTPAVTYTPRVLGPGPR